ncbi:class I SAM-dependent methyltransferase [Xylanibacillus composti]|uniref:Methyltransferase type 11 n=1 Tax=Xylanibacillus composti TaxID=1572762 RepID=A0A8J4H1P1_9BACL|nr:methyltransferase domain-containing protein [Xylanibacillus composti]MDT9726751.1 class I SAM-dependent methyltransferase [Xylanibacillus composti]GIQ69317.1 methyltransferase type 11 [Xylanibacillus composti]
MGESWNQFFGADYLSFSEVILSPERTAYELEAIMQRLKLSSGMRVLDLGCGQGRMSIALAKQGMEVVGYDGSAALLEEARRRAEEQGANVGFVLGDMRELQSEDEFDAIINIGTAFGYIEDEEGDREILRRVYRALKPGGHFLQDTENRDFKLRQLYNTWEKMNGRLVFSRRAFHHHTGRWTEELNWYTEGDREHALLDLRLYTATELVRMTEAAGLQVRELHGGFDLSPFSLSSPRLVIVSEKCR